MTTEDYESRIEKYQNIIEDLYCALCEQKQENECKESEIRKLRGCLERNYEEEYDD